MVDGWTVAVFAVQATGFVAALVVALILLVGRRRDDAEEHKQARHILFALEYRGDATADDLAGHLGYSTWTRGLLLRRLRDLEGADRVERYISHLSQPAGSRVPYYRITSAGRRVLAS